eukprot:8881838-Pyramimonas_sp.AAC.1
MRKTKRKTQRKTNNANKWNDCRGQGEIKAEALTRRTGQTIQTEQTQHEKRTRTAAVASGLRLGRVAKSRPAATAEGW